MNSIVTVDTQDPGSSGSAGVSVVSARAWSTEPDGRHDRPVDIWYNGNWVPAFFKDIRKGDFYLLIGMDLEPGRCFRAGADAKRMVPRHNILGTAEDPTFVILGGMEVVQAPSIVDLNPAITHRGSNDHRIESSSTGRNPERLAGPGGE